MKFVGKGAFLLKVHPSIYAVVHACGYGKQEAPKKQYRVRGGTNKGRQTPINVIIVSVPGSIQMPPLRHAFSIHTTIVMYVYTVCKPQCTFLNLGA